MQENINFQENQFNIENPQVIFGHGETKNIIGTITYEGDDLEKDGKTPRGIYLVLKENKLYIARSKEDQKESYTEIVSLSKENMDAINKIIDESHKAGFQDNDIGIDICRCDERHNPVGQAYRLPLRMA